MKWVFWISTIFILYAYFGYPLLLYGLNKLRCRPVLKGDLQPVVSIIVAVRNDAERLETKLRNLFDSHYPRHLLDIVIASDGSTDRTTEVLKANSFARSVIIPEHVGKAEAINQALKLVRGEIVVFTDVRQEIEPGAIQELVSNFADPDVGCVSGELLFKCDQVTGKTGFSAYWAFEKMVRKLESSTGSVVGATGALYAVRRELIPPLPKGTLLDDVYIPLSAVSQRKRAIFEPNARVWDVQPAAASLEFSRKVRTLAGNYQLLQFAPWLLTSRNPLRFRFISHKLLRLWVPFLLLALFCSSIALSGISFFTAAAACQIIFYGLAIIGLCRLPIPFASAAASFCVLNAAAAVALVQFWRYRNNTTLLWRIGSYQSAIANARAEETPKTYTTASDTPTVTTQRVS